MAIKINATNTIRELFAARPDIQVDITLEDGEHQWTLHGGGILLRSELSRYMLSVRDLGNLSKDAENDAETTRQLNSEIEASWKRFKSCFLANMTSEDGSSERWINEAHYDFVNMPTILNQVLSQAVGGSND